MCVDLRIKSDEIEYNGEDVTISPTDMGDYIVMPCKDRVRRLTPKWNEHRLSERQVYAMIEEHRCDAVEVLESLGFPKQGFEWLDRGHSVVFTCIALETLDSLLFSYNGIQ
jgi:hypothetical protein